MYPYEIRYIDFNGEQLGHQTCLSFFFSFFYLFYFIFFLLPFPFFSYMNTGFDTEYFWPLLAFWPCQE